MAEKIVRDPVHDVIVFRRGRPVESLLFDLLNAAEFQRLRRVRQLGLAHLAYPGADHSRYGHSLGVMETARRMIEQLCRDGGGEEIDELGEAALLSAALLHDLGHGPFSHVFERVSGVHHESTTRRVIADAGSQVHRRLAAFSAELPGRVLEALGGLGVGGGPKSWAADVLSGQLDADRLDYLLRDDLMTGSRYGNYDFQWLVRSLVVDPWTRRLAVSYKGVSAVEGYLQARYHMYRNVYFHKVVRSGEGMLRLALQRARRLAVQDRLPGGGGSPGSGEAALRMALLGQQMTVAEFTELDDVTVMHCFKVWSHGDDGVLAGLCRGLLYRQLFKTIELPGDAPLEAVTRAVDAAYDAVADAGGDPAYAMFYDDVRTTPYEMGPGQEIGVCDAAGTLRPLTEFSPFAAALGRPLVLRRLHVEEGYKPAALAAVRGVLKG